MVPVGEVENIHELANLFNCKVGSLRIARWDLCPLLVLACHWGLLLNQQQFGILFWRDLNVIYLVGRGCTYLKGEGWRY